MKLKFKEKIAMPDDNKPGHTVTGPAIRQQQLEVDLASRFSSTGSANVVQSQLQQVCQLIWAPARGRILSCPNCQALQSFALCCISHADSTTNSQLLQLQIRAETVTDRVSGAYSTRALQQ
jgi:hypothetical protein